MPRVAEHVVADRRRRVADLVGRERYLPVAAVAEKVGVSEATARRDLAALTGDGRLARTFGGAVAVDAPPAGVRRAVRRGLADNVIDVDVPEDAAAASHRRVAKKALPRLTAGATAYLDAGPCSVALARLLAAQPPRPGRGLRVVTPSLVVAASLAQVRGVKLHLLGGQIDPETLSACGEPARRAAAGFDLDVALIDVTAIGGRGAFGLIGEASRLQRHVALRAASTVVLAPAGAVGAEVSREAGRVLLAAEVDAVATDAAASDLASAGLEVARGQLL